MSKIHKLDQDTINKIAAGEVVERPMAVVKELIENAVDAEANSITVEIKDGGTSLIRITDNGSGMEEEDIRMAFTPHATSKISDVSDLLEVSTLGFRGEALASIASVSQLELVTKTRKAFMGFRYCIDGGEEKGMESVGCPEGTTLLVRNLFYNTPARLKFLKTPPTEAGYINALMERLALSHPEIAFRFINQGKPRIHTSGNGNIKDVIYHIYGREIAGNLIEMNSSEISCQVNGYIGKPVISRGNRNFMNYFINGRYIKSSIIHKAIEDAYAPYSMQHRYPFTALHFTIAPSSVDINVHPQKMEIRFTDAKGMYQSIYHAVSEALKRPEHIPEISIARPNLKKEPPVKLPRAPEPFETKRQREDCFLRETPKDIVPPEKQTAAPQMEKTPLVSQAAQTAKSVTKPEQESLFQEGILSDKAQKECKIIGQVFSTYWILQYEEGMYLVDQHAAHEKVLYESFLKQLAKKEPMSQLLQPPVILTLSMGEELVVKEYGDIFSSLGYQIEHFGGKEYAVTGVPAHLPEIREEELLKEIIDTLVDDHARSTPEMLQDKIASMSCKAAVKGNNRLPEVQIHALLKELMTLQNPYHCPHGRPTMIKISKQELEKKFKRIV